MKNKQFSPQNPGKAKNSEDPEHLDQGIWYPTHSLIPQVKDMSFLLWQNLIEVQGSEVPRRWRAGLTTKRLIESV